VPVDSAYVIVCGRRLRSPHFCLSTALQPA
jgi:hypothetical protein